MAAERPPTQAAVLRTLVGGDVLGGGVGGIAVCPDRSIALTDNGAHVVLRVSICVIGKINSGFIEKTFNDVEHLYNSPW